MNCASSAFSLIFEQSPSVPHLQNTLLHQGVLTDLSFDGGQLLVVVSAGFIEPQWLLSLHLVCRLELSVLKCLVGVCPSICQSSQSCLVQPQEEGLAV